MFWFVQKQVYTHMGCCACSLKFILLFLRLKAERKVTFLSFSSVYSSSFGRTTAGCAAMLPLAQLASTSPLCSRQSTCQALTLYFLPTNLPETTHWARCDEARAAKVWTRWTASMPRCRETCIFERIKQLPFNERKGERRWNGHGGFFLLWWNVAGGFAEHMNTFALLSVRWFATCKSLIWSSPSCSYFRLGSFRFVFFSLRANILACEVQGHAHQRCVFDYFQAETVGIQNLVFLILWHGCKHIRL